MSLFLQTVNWHQAASRCLAIREQVFIVEQGIKRAIEIDGQDPLCRHALGTIDGEDIATARMLPDGHIGRVAVLAPWRSQGVGQALIRHLCGVAQAQGLASVYLASQHSAIGFYQAIGFQAEGPIFIEADIPHQTMRLNL